MPNDYSGRIWKVVQAGTTPFGAANVKFEGGSWSGGAAGQTFIITDIAGRVYQWVYAADGSVTTFQKLGWLSGPLSFSGTFAGEINLYLGTK